MVSNGYITTPDATLSSWLCFPSVIRSLTFCSRTIEWNSPRVNYRFVCLPFESLLFTSGHWHRQCIHTLLVIYYFNVQTTSSRGKRSNSMLLPIERIGLHGLFHEELVICNIKIHILSHIFPASSWNPASKLSFRMNVAFLLWMFIHRIRLTLENSFPPYLPKLQKSTQYWRSLEKVHMV